jgi:hypothetical protein
MTVPFKGVIAGAAGAIALTALHEVARVNLPRAPRLDSLGKRSIQKFFDFPATRDLALGSDLAANSVYYGMVGTFGAKAAPFTGAFLGLAAGVGSVLLPEPLGLGSDTTNRTRETQALSIGMYLAGGLVAGAVYRALSD